MACVNAMFDYERFCFVDCYVHVWAYAPNRNRAVEGSPAWPWPDRFSRKLGLEIHAKSMFFGPGSVIPMKNSMIPW